jgi:hypothetical protein
VANYITVRGAYGRDYTSLAKAKADWLAGKDFEILTLGYHRYVSKREVQAGDVIMVRYRRNLSIGELAKG